MDSQPQPCRKHWSRQASWHDTRHQIVQRRWQLHYAAQRSRLLFGMAGWSYACCSHALCDLLHTQQARASVSWRGACGWCRVSMNRALTSSLLSDIGIPWNRACMLVSWRLGRNFQVGCSRRSNREGGVGLACPQLAIQSGLLCKPGIKCLECSRGILVYRLPVRHATSCHVTPPSLFLTMVGMMRCLEETRSLGGSRGRRWPSLSKTYQLRRPAQHKPGNR